MNINCTDKCKYQSDGKCVMTALPESMPYSVDGDCPYRQQ